MSVNLLDDIRKAEQEAKRIEQKKTRKVIKKHQYFIIKFPNGVEAVIKCPNGWVGVTRYIKYFKDEYDDNILVIAISKSEASKFVRKGSLFNVNK